MASKSLGFGSVVGAFGQEWGMRRGRENLGRALGSISLNRQG